MGTLEIDIFFRRYFSIVPDIDIRAGSDLSLQPMNPIAVFALRNFVQLAPVNRNLKISCVLDAEFQQRDLTARFHQVD